MELVKTVAEDILHEDVQFVLLGTGNVEYEEYFKALGVRYEGKTSINIAFNGLGVLYEHTVKLVFYLLRRRIEYSENTQKKNHYCDKEGYYENKVNGKSAAHGSVYIFEIKVFKHVFVLSESEIAKGFEFRKGRGNKLSENSFLVLALVYSCGELIVRRFEHRFQLVFKIALNKSRTVEKRNGNK